MSDSKAKVAVDAPDWYYCQDCDQTMSKAEELEHKDWHMAKDLQNQSSNAPSAPAAKSKAGAQATKPPSYNPPPGPPPGQPVQTFYTTNVNFQGSSAMDFGTSHHYRNQVSNAAEVRARDEQQMQNMLQRVQLQYRIYNPEIEPEHGDENAWCGCAIHEYKRAKIARWGVRRMWHDAVVYPGERSYLSPPTSQMSFINNNPYNSYNVGSPFGTGYYNYGWMPQMRPVPEYHQRFIMQTMSLNNRLNQEEQQRVRSLEPRENIWIEPSMEDSMSKLSMAEPSDQKYPPEKGDKKGKGWAALPERKEKPVKQSKMASLRKSFGIKSTAEKDAEFNFSLKHEILREEAGRWPDAQWRELVWMYQDKIGLQEFVANLRNQCPIQYLHLLRAGYFEPIPVAWADQVSNPLKFIIDAAESWPGITPTWRGYEDTAEERLYWVLNNRKNAAGRRLKPDFVSVMEMAMSRMNSAVEPPPQYFSPNDVCHLQHTSEGYSRQVMPAPFVPHDRPEKVSDDTMILLDVSGSMEFDPMRPIYDRYLITDYFRTTQPKNKDVARSIVRRFTDAMINHDHMGKGYDLVTFSSHARHIGAINHRNFDNLWSSIGFGGGTRVMTGWQKVKDLHFRKHSESAIHHPVFGWQAGPQTPMLRLLLLLDGEATDMDEFELDLLGLSWAHVTIFLIGVDGCPHHHRHANELQRISDVNQHVTFVDAQGNMPERFVTHELLKRHLGYDISMREFEEMEQPPPYTE